MAWSQLKPKLIFWRCIDLLAREKFQTISYFRLAELILEGINNRKKILIEIIERTLTISLRQSLNDLFVQKALADDEQKIPKTAAYRLTLLKKFSQSTKPSKVKERVADLLLLKKLYKDLNLVLKALNLNHEGIRYYATSVIKSEIFQMVRRSSDDRYLHVIAFVAYQYYRLQVKNTKTCLNRFHQSFGNVMKLIISAHFHKE